MFTNTDTVTGLCARFNQSRDELTELALEEEAKSLNGQLHNIPTSKLNGDDGEPPTEDKREPLFGKAGQDRLITNTRGTRSGKQRVNNIKELVGIEGGKQLEVGLDGSIQQVRFELAPDGSINQVQHELGLDGSIDQVQHELGLDGSIKQVRFATHDTIKEIPPNQLASEAYSLGDLVLNRPIMDSLNGNPVLSGTEGPYDGCSYACLHIMQKALADELTGMSRKKDMDWKEVLDTVHLKELAIKAFDKEVDSLTNKHQVLRELMEGDPDYATALKEANYMVERFSTSNEMRARRHGLLNKVFESDLIKTNPSPGMW